MTQPGLKTCMLFLCNFTSVWLAAKCLTLEMTPYLLIVYIVFESNICHF